MPTQAYRPSALDPTSPHREDVGKPSRFWTFINRSSYYVFISMGFAESAVLSDPDFVIEPYTVQRVDFRTPQDRIVWQANAEYPRAQHAAGSEELFGFLATDTPLHAYPASVLYSGAIDVNLLGQTLARLESLEELAGFKAIRLKAETDPQDRFIVDNLGRAFAGDGVEIPDELWEIISLGEFALQKCVQFRNNRSVAEIIDVVSEAANPNTACFSWFQVSNIWQNHTAASNAQDASVVATQFAAAGSAVYVGNDDMFDALDITVATAGAGAIAGVWEYWNGAAWVAAPGQVESAPGVALWKVNGRLTFTRPGDWVQRTLTGVHAAAPPDAVSRYWMRFRVTTASSTNASADLLRGVTVTHTPTPQITVEPTAEWFDTAGNRVAYMTADGDLVVHSVTETVGGTSAPEWNVLSGSAFVAAGSPAPAYRREGDRVYLRGLFTAGAAYTAGGVIATLPVGFRPPVAKRGVIVSGSTATSIVQITTAGEIQWLAGVSAVGAQYFLDTLHFEVN